MKWTSSVEFVDQCQEATPPVPYGALLEDSTGRRYLLVRPQPQAHLDSGTVLRIEDATLLHPSWMEFPVHLVAESLDQYGEQRSRRVTAYLQMRQDLEARN